MRYIGIDVSKATFVVAYSSDKGGEIRTFNNTTTGIKQFIGALPKDGSIHCVMEATGNYSAMLLYLLNVAGIAVSMENPLKIKNFARAMLSTVKTDKIDARLIALYGEKMNPQPFKIQGEAILRLRQNGKPGKLAMIAVANKLVRQAFAVVTHDKEYVDGFVSNRP